MPKPNSSTVPISLNRTFTPRAVAVLVTLAVTVTLGIIAIGYQLFPASNPLLGVWQATDEYGGQHFYEFQENGKLIWWDIDRGGLNSEPKKRGPFHGIYRKEKDTIIAQAVGLFGPRVGILRWQGKDTLRQDHDGHIMRQNLTYTRVVKSE